MDSIVATHRSVTFSSRSNNQEFHQGAVRGSRRLAAKTCRLGVTLYDTSLAIVEMGLGAP